MQELARCARLDRRLFRMVGAFQTDDDDPSNGRRIGTYVDAAVRGAGSGTLLAALLDQLVQGDRVTSPAWA